MRRSIKIVIRNRVHTLQKRKQGFYSKVSQAERERSGRGKLFPKFDGPRKRYPPDQGALRCQTVSKRRGRKAPDKKKGGGGRTAGQEGGAEIMVQ